jgi:hypothetical protein
LLANATFLGDGRWTIRYTNDGVSTLQVSYDATKGWFTSITDVSNDSEAILAELASKSTGSGPGYAYALGPLDDKEFSRSFASFGSFTVEDDYTDLLYGVEYSCTSQAVGTYEAIPRDAPGSGISETIACPGSKAWTQTVIEPVPGPWVTTIAMTSDPAQGTFEFRSEVLARILIEVSI